MDTDSWQVIFQSHIMRRYNILTLRWHAPYYPSAVSFISFRKFMLLKWLSFPLSVLKYQYTVTSALIASTCMSVPQLLWHFDQDTYPQYYLLISLKKCTASTLSCVHDILQCSDASFGKHFEYCIVKYVATHWVQITHKPSLNCCVNKEIFSHFMFDQDKNIHVP